MKYVPTAHCHDPLTDTFSSRQRSWVVVLYTDKYADYTTECIHSQHCAQLTSDFHPIPQIISFPYFLNPDHITVDLAWFPLVSTKIRIDFVEINLFSALTKVHPTHSQPPHKSQALHLEPFPTYWWSNAGEICSPFEILMYSHPLDSYFLKNGFGQI